MKPKDLNLVLVNNWLQNIKDVRKLQDPKGVCQLSVERFNELKHWMMKGQDQATIEHIEYIQFKAENGITYKVTGDKSLKDEVIISYTISTNEFNIFNRLN